MRRGYYSLLVVLVVMLAFAVFPARTSAQGGPLPDLAITNVSYCVEWAGDWTSLPGAPLLRYNMITRLTFYVRNVGPADAVPAYNGWSEFTRWIYVEARNLGWTTDPAHPWRIRRQYARISAGQTVGPFILRAAMNGDAGYSVSVDFPSSTTASPIYGNVRESNEKNNTAYAYWLNASRANLPWCPGYRPRAYGRVFKDVNRNGRQDRGEPGVSGVIVEVWQGSRRVGRTTSGWDGSWSISVSRPGTYSVVAIVPARVRTTLGGGVSWTTPSRYFGVPLTGGSTGPYRFGLAAMPPPPPAEKPIEPRPEASIGWGTAVTRPVVVGQDPDRRGADVFVTIRVRPATYTWYEFNPTRGRWEKKQATVTDYVDLDSIRLVASLSTASRRWIRSELAARYPGARVRRPFWNLQARPTYRVIRNEVLPDGTHEVEIAVTRIPFEDPGVYNVRLTVRTMGTSWPGSRVSNPNYLVKPAATSTGAQDVRSAAPLKVWLLDTTLTY